MKKYNIAIPRTPQKLDQVGKPHLLYVSCWEQTAAALPRTLHSHPEFAEFTFIFSGQGVCELDGTFYPITKGDLVVCNKGVLHDEFADSQSISLVSIAADGITLPGLPDNCVLPGGRVPIFHLDAKAAAFHSLITLLADEVKSTDARLGLTCQSLFLALFYLMLDTIDTYYHKHSEVTNSTVDMGHQIRAYVDAHVTEDLTVNEITEIFQISPSYLARIFKRSIGCPLSKYIIRRRLGEAQTLLLNSNLPISEISLRVGYPNQSYFTKLFTQAFGVSPLQYRKISSERLINLSPSETGGGAV